jgi:LacI family transcriptional regulator
MAIRRIEQRVLLILDPHDGYDRRALTGIGQYARATSTWDFRSYCPWEVDSIRKLLDIWQPTGILSRFNKWGPELFQHLISTEIPLVELDAQDPQIQIPQVYTDARAVVELAAHHMMQLGIRSFGYIGGSTPLDARQIEIFAEFVGKKGFAFASFQAEVRDEHDPAREFHHWLKQRPLPTGLLAASDWVGWHVIAGCLNSGFRVPEDFAVMGINDDQPWSELATVPLSSVAIAAEKIGYRAASLLDQMMRGQSVARMSTDMIAAEDPDIAQVLRYIHDHAAEGCTMKDVLRAVPTHRRRVEQWFDQNLGRSPFKEIQRIRIAHVKKLLADTDEPMEGIARRCGFPTAKLLSRAFHREAGMTLLQYRNQFTRSVPELDSA